MAIHLAALAASSTGTVVLTDVVTPIAVALITVGFGKFALDLVKAFKERTRARSAEERDALHVTAADQSLLVVVRARDELADDLERTRRQAGEDAARYDADRRRWEADRQTMRGEIDSLEAKIRGLLTEVEGLKARHA